MSRLKPLPSLSVFLPCFNEADNLPLMIERLVNVLPEISRHYELIIVNDGSRDKTVAVVIALQKKYPFIRLINHPKNVGYGMALRSGFTAATYEWVFFTDGDNQFDVSELKKFIPYADDYNVVIGYRRHRAEGGVRAFNARLFKLFIDILFRLHVKDIDCAFKLMKTDLVKQINFYSTGAMISSELLYRLKKLKEPFKQVAVNHYARKYGKPTGNNLAVVIKAGFEAIKLYVYMKFGFALS